MQFRVHHLDDEVFARSNPVSLPKQFMDAKMGFRDDGSQETACLDLFQRGLYKHVATVQARDIELAWHLTNHAQGDWTLNRACAAEPGPQRSSSVGDIFELPDGKLFVCATMGFRELSHEPAGLALPQQTPKRAKP